MIILSHPIQYFSPLFAELSRRPNLDIEVWYGHRGAVSGMLDEQFGTEVHWGTSLLEGYRYRFFRNASLRPRLGGHFWGVVNPGMLPALVRYRPDAILVPGWAYCSYTLAWFFALLLRIPVWIRTDNPWSQEKIKSGAKQKLKRWILRHIAFRSVARFLAVGKENAEWYRQLGVLPGRIVQAPHSVDTKHFALSDAARGAQRLKVRSEFGVPEDACLFLFVGKLIEKKRPIELLEAASMLPKSQVLFVGEGREGPALRHAAQQRAQDRIHFAGFVNQQVLRAFYAAADVLVLPSGMGETWGLVVNEAMAAGLPVIVSNLCGCAPDLVKDGVNGFTYPCGDTTALRKHMNWFIENAPVRSSFGDASRRISGKFSIKATAHGFERAVETVEPNSASEGRDEGSYRL